MDNLLDITECRVSPDGEHMIIRVLDDSFLCKVVTKKDAEGKPVAVLDTDPAIRKIPRRPETKSLKTVLFLNNDYFAIGKLNKG